MSNTVPGRHAQQREPRADRNTRSKTRDGGPVAMGILNKEYRKLKFIEQILIDVIDSFSPSKESVVFRVDYCTLLNVVRRIPRLQSVSIIAMLHTLRDRNAIAFDIIVEPEGTTLLVSPWKYRTRLATALSVHISRNAAARKTIADGASPEEAVAA